MDDTANVDRARSPDAEVASLTPTITHSRTPSAPRGSGSPFPSIGQTLTPYPALDADAGDALVERDGGGRPVLIAMCGLPATGKTYISHGAFDRARLGACRH